MRLLIWDQDGALLGWIEDTEDDRVRADPSAFKSLAFDAIRGGATAAQAIAALDGWSNGYAFVAADDGDDGEPEVEGEIIFEGNYLDQLRRVQKLARSVG